MASYWLVELGYEYVIPRNYSEISRGDQDDNLQTQNRNHFRLGPIALSYFCYYSFQLGEILLVYYINSLHTGCIFQMCLLFLHWMF